MMARAKPETLAERYRRHRRAFRLALELGCTPKEAELEIERRETRARWQRAQERLQTAMAGPRRGPAPAGARWMMQD